MKKHENAPATKTGKKLWVSPWSYTESFIIAISLILLGFFVEIVFQGQQVPVPHRPYNFIILFVSVLLLVSIHIFLGKTAFVKWLSSVPCSVSAILSYALLVMLLGSISQDGGNQHSWMQIPGLNHLKNSWPFLFIEIYLFVSLGMVVLKRSYPFTYKNFGFLLNHFGLWLTLMAAALGSGDLQRLKISVFENRDFSGKGLLTGHQIYNLPFAVKLIDFKMEMYSPQIILSDTLSGQPQNEKGESLPLIEKGSEYKLNNYSIKVLNVLPSAARTNNGYVASSLPMASAAALVHIKNLTTGDSVTNWICCGSQVMLPEYIQLEKNLGLWLLKPVPKKFESLIVIKTKSGDMDTATIEVNKPYKTRGWSLYQIGYDEKLGSESNLSIIEAVYDPWIKVVYIGIALMLAGAAYLFWQGRGVKSRSEE
jgi:hypothetical protein